MHVLGQYSGAPWLQHPFVGSKSAGGATVVERQKARASRSTAKGARTTTRANAAPSRGRRDLERARSRAMGAPPGLGDGGERVRERPIGEDVDRPRVVRSRGIHQVRDVPRSGEALG